MFQSRQEVLRHGHAPTKYDEQQLQRIARYAKRVPRCIQHFKWTEEAEAVLETYVDSDWSGEEDTRKSTSGGVVTYCGTELKHWCVTQPTVRYEYPETAGKRAYDKNPHRLVSSTRALS